MPKPKKDRVDPTLTRPGGLSYLEIPAADPVKSAHFYAKVFGWAIEALDTPSPKFMDPSRHLLGRWIPTRAAARKPGWLPYIYVDQIKKAIRSVPKLGGEVTKLPYREGNIFVAVIRDPGGNLVGVWQEA